MTTGGQPATFSDNSAAPNGHHPGSDPADGSLRIDRETPGGSGSEGVTAPPPSQPYNAD